MKKSLKITLVSALALSLLAGCAASPASSAESVTATPSAAETTQSAALSDSALDTTVSKRDASGEYDASEAVALAPDGDLTVTEAGTYILSGEYEGMIVVEVGRAVPRSTSAARTRSFSPRRRVRSTRSLTARIIRLATTTPRWTRPCSAGTISRSTAPAS